MTRRKALTQKAIDDYTVAWRAHNKDCRRRQLHCFVFESLEQYIKYVRNEKYTPPKNPVSKPKIPAVDKTAKIPSHTASVGNCVKTEPNVYSGERKLVGIAVMHKSNLVPVFADEDGDARQEATELANMQR